MTDTYPPFMPVFVYGKLNKSACLNGRRVSVHWITMRDADAIIPAGMNIIGEITEKRRLRTIGARPFGQPLRNTPNELQLAILSQDLDADFQPRIFVTGDQVCIFSYREEEAAAAARTFGIMPPEPSMAQYAWDKLFSEAEGNRCA